MSPSPGTCRHAIELLCDFLDGTLPEEKRAALERHLSSCPPCVEYLNTYRATPTLCRKALGVAMPAELAGRLSSFLRQRICKP